MRSAAPSAVAIGALVIALAACSGPADSRDDSGAIEVLDSPEDSAAVTSTSVGADASPEATPPPVSPQVTPLTDSPVTPLTGRWFRTEPDLPGLLTIPLDVMWDGEAVYVMARVAFGDVRVWRSIDGLAWEELPTLGVVGTLEGPTALYTAGDTLMALGTRGTDATLWVFEGQSPWRETSLGFSATFRDVLTHRGRYLAVGRSPAWHESAGGEVPDRSAVIWASEDGADWTRVVGAEVLGDNSSPLALYRDGDGVIALATAWDPESSEFRESLAVTSVDGITWSPTDPETVGFPMRSGSRLLVVPTSGDGSTWRLVDEEAPPTNPTALGSLTEFEYFMGRWLGIGQTEDLSQPSERGLPVPAVWSQSGGDNWVLLGDPPLDGVEAVVGAASVGDRLIVLGWGGDGHNWGILTFVLESPVEDVVLTWVNATGLGMVDPGIWTERLGRACTEGVWTDEVALALAEEFMAEDEPYSLRDAQSDTPTAADGAQALWQMAVNYCRGDFPAGEIQDGPPGR